MLRSYTRAINKQESRTGSLFQQNTAIKPLDETHAMTQSHGMSNQDDYPFICFHYIHQNPVKAGLAEKMEDWEMSSFRDYLGLWNGTLCKKELAYELLEIPDKPKDFLIQSNEVKVFDDFI